MLYNVQYPLMKAYYDARIKFLAQAVGYLVNPNNKAVCTVQKDSSFHIRSVGSCVLC